MASFPFADMVYVAVACLIILLACMGLGVAFLKVGTTITNSTLPFNQTVPGTSVTPIQIFNLVGGNIFLFDTYIPILFLGMNIAIIFLTALLASDPRGWAFGIFSMVFLVFFFILLSNIAHGIIGNSLFAPVVSKFSQSITIYANLPKYQIVFIFIDLLVIAARNYFVTSAPTSSSGRGPV